MLPKIVEFYAWLKTVESVIGTLIILGIIIYLIYLYWIGRK